MTVYTGINDLVKNAGALSPLVISKYRTENTLITSGIATTGPEVDLLMSGGSQLQGLNFVNKVDTDNYNHSSDNFDEKGATGKITAAAYMALRQDINWGWAYTDLVRMITKYDVKAGLTSAIPMYWAEVSEKIAISSLKGAIASDADLTVGEGTEAFSLELLVDAATAMQDDATNLFVSRKTKAKLQKMNISAYKEASETNLRFDRFAGYNVFVTEAFGDDVTVVAETGSLVFATGLVPGTVGMEIGRDVNAGNGGGGEILRTRLSIVTQPQGMSYKGTVKPTRANLETGTNWAVAVDDLKQLGFRAVKHTI